MLNVLFIGQAKTAIDEKGRTSFPREFRRQLPVGEEKNLVVTIGPSRTLNVFTEAMFREHLAGFMSRPNTPQNAQFLDRLTSMSNYVELDGQNRLMLTRKQMEYAQLAGEVTFVGRGSTIVMRNPEIFEAATGFVQSADYEQFDQDYFGSGSVGVGANG